MILVPGEDMSKKIFAIVFCLLLSLGGMLTAFGGEGTNGRHVVIEENGPFFAVEIIDYPEEVELGEVIEIEYLVKNTGDAEGTQDIILTVKAEEVDFEEEFRDEDVTLAPNDEWTNEHTYDTDEIPKPYGIDIIELEVDVEILLESDDDSDSGKSTVKSPGVIPGFTFILLLLGVSFAAVIHHKKK